MVIEMVSPASWGALGLAVDFVETDLVRIKNSKEKIGVLPWALVQTQPAPRSMAVYPPALSRSLRAALSDGSLVWVNTAAANAASVTHLMLESGLFAGVLLVGLDSFTRAAPAPLWSRRWQLAARRGSSHFVWVHEQTESLVGFDVRLEWTAPSVFEIKKGHGFFEKRGENVVFNGARYSDKPAA